MKRVFFEHPSSIVLAMITGFLVILCCAEAFAQLADTMLCADESCSEADEYLRYHPLHASIHTFQHLVWVFNIYLSTSQTAGRKRRQLSGYPKTISQGEARLAYRPKDEKFLHLNKGDVVHVKSKNAGKKTHLWGGEVMGSNRFGFFPSSFIREYMILVQKPTISVSVQDFLKDKIPNSETDDPYSELIGKKQTRKNEEGVDEENKNGDNSEDDDTKENEFSNKDTKNVEKIAQSEDIVQKQRSKRNIDELSVEKNLNQEFEKLQKDSQSHEDSSVNEQGESEKEPTGDTSSETVSSAKFKVENIPDKIPADLAALLGETDKDQSGSEQQVPPGRSQTPTEKNSDKKVELEPKNEVDTGDSSENDSTDVTRKKFTEKQSNEINSPINLSEPSHDMDGKKLPVLQGEGDDDVPSEDSEKNLTEIKSPTFTGSEENLPKVDDAHSESDEEKSADEPNQQPSEVTDTFTNSNEIPSEDSKAQSETLSSQTISNTVEADTQHKKDQLTSSDLPDDVNPSPGLPKTVTETEHEETGGTIHSGSTDTLVENSVTGENSPNVDIDKSGLVENTNLNLTDESKLGQVDDSTYISSAEESAEDRSETDQKLSNPKHEDGHIEMLPDPNTQNQGIEDGSETNTENIDNPVERAKTNHLESDDSKAHDLDGTNNNISVQNQETDPLNDAGTKQDDEQIAKNSVENYVDETHKVKTDASDTETDTKETKSYDSVKDKSDDQVSMKGIDKKELKSSPEKEKMDYKATDDSTGTEKEKIEQTQQVNYPDTTSGALVETADTDNFPPTHLEDSEPVDKVKVSEESDSVVVETASKIDYDILEESPHLKDGIGKNADVPEHQTGLENTENQDSLIDINEKIDEEQVEMQGTNDEDIVHSTINEIATEEVNVKEAIGDDSNESEDKSNTELTNTTSLHEEDEQNHKIVHSKHESSKEIVNEIEQDSKKVSEINNSQHQVEEAKQPNTDAKSTGESERKPNEQEIEYNDQDVVKIEEHLPTVTQPNIESNTSVENDDKTAKNKVVERNEEEDDGTIPESKSDELSHDAPDANEILKQEIETEDTKKLDSSDAEIKNVGTVSESQSVNEEPDPSGSGVMFKYGDDALLKWFDSARGRNGVCGVGKDIIFDNIGDGTLLDTSVLGDEDKMHNIAPDYDRSLHVVNNPLLSQTVLVVMDNDSEDLDSSNENVVEEGHGEESTDQNGCSSYLDDPKLQWILSRMKSKAIQGPTGFFSKSVNEYSSYKDHPVLKWVVLRSEMCKDTPPSVTYVENSIAFGKDQSLHVIDNPLSLQTMLANYDGDQQGMIKRNILIHDGDRMGTSSYLNDPKLRWILSRIKSKSLSQTTKLSEDSKTSSYLNDPKLRWILSRIKSKSLSQTAKLSEDSKTSSYLNDPKLRWILSRINSKSLSQTTKLSKDSKTLGTNSMYNIPLGHDQSLYMIDNPLLLESVLRQINVKQDMTTNVGVLDKFDTPGRCSNYRNDPLLKWFFYEKDMCKVCTKTLTAGTISRVKNIEFLPEINTETSAESDIKENEEDHNSYFNDPLLKWILPSNTKLENKINSDNGENIIHTDVYQLDGSDLENPLFSEKTLPNEAVTVRAVVTGDDTHIQQKSESQQKANENLIDTDASVKTEELFGSSESSSWMILRQLLNSYQESYEDTVTFRVGIADIIRDMRILKKSKPQATTGLHTSTKTLKQNVISLENEILLHIQTLTRMVYGAGVLKKNNQKDDEEKHVLKYENLLSSIVVRIKRMQNDLGALHQRITEELYVDTEAIDFEHSTKEEEPTSEIKALREKLIELDEKIAAKSTESESLLLKMKDDANIFTARIAELEVSFTKKKEDETLQAVHAEEQETKLNKKIDELQTTINERNKKQFEIAKEQNQIMNERLKELEASLKMTVETDKPIAERITFLEAELSSRKQQEIETTKQDKFEVTLLRSKIQTMERQLRKKQLHGSTVMLHEAKVLKDKIRKLEDDLSDRALMEEGKLVSNKENEGEMLERVSNLENELREQIQSVSSAKDNSETINLKSRVEAMESRLKAQLEKMENIKSTPIAMKSTEKSKKAKHSKMTQKQISELLDILFPDKEKSIEQPLLYKNQTEQIINNSEATAEFDQKDLEPVNSDIDFKCIVEPTKRKACGDKHFSKDFCVGLQCCWHPVDDPLVPPCYFSLLQIANPDNKEIHDPSQADVIEKGAEQYNALHEGQVVDWNEMIGEKVAEKNAVGWDESLEGTDNSATLADDQPPTDIIPDEVAERELNDTVTEKPSTSATENDEIEAVPEVQYEDQTGVTTPPPETETQIVSDDTKPEDPKYNEQVLIDNHKELHAEQIETENTTVENMLENADGEIDDSIDEEKPTTDENELHVESFWLRLLLGISRIPFDMIYILEPLLNFWVSLLPEEYQNDVHGVSWKIIASTLFIGFILSWLMICRSKAVSRKRRSQHSEQTIKELKSQLENMSQEKIAAENELRTKQNEVEIQREEINNETILKETVTQEKQGLEQSLAKYNMDNENLKSDIQSLTQGLKEKDAAMQEVLNNSQQVEKSLIAQQEAITRHKETIAALQANITEHENHKQSSDVSTDKLKERMKMLEKAKGETKKEGKILKDQIEKMNTKVGELQEKLDVEVEENEAKRQEIDILKDCILQFKGAQEYLGDDAEDADSEQAIENQKEKLKSMIDVANVKTTLRQTEAEKLQVTYELEAERKSRLDNEGKISELEATINSNTALHNKLEKEKQMLDSKLTVMQEFYAKREVEIQSKLGLEQSKRESNASMLEDQQHKQLELLQQLDAYKKMGEEAKHKYDDAERQHKQEVLAFEKKSHENWLACRSTERKLEEATKQINQLHLELSDARHRLHDREPIIRPRPERHGPPGAPPPFGPPLRKPLPGSPLHFRNGPPPDMRRRSSPPRRPPSPGGSIPGDRPPSRPERPTSRPDRPPSTHSLPPMDRPPQPRPPFPNTPGREFRPYRDDIPPGRPPLRDAPHQGRPGPRMPGGPMNSSPYMERPPIPPSQSPGSRSMNYTQSTLHATPPQSTGDGLRNDGLPPPPNASERPPPGMDSGQGNPFRRGRS